MSAIYINIRRSPGRIYSLGINADCNPPKNTISCSFTKIDIVQHRVCIGGFLGKDSVIGVKKEDLSVCVVRGIEFDGIDEGLVEEELADVGDMAAR